VFKVVLKLMLSVTGLSQVMIKLHSAGPTSRSVSSSQEKICGHCILKNLAVINSCVQNSPRQDWQAGIDPNHAFYQTGFCKLNSPDGNHSTIDESHTL